MLVSYLLQLLAIFTLAFVMKKHYQLLFIKPLSAKTILLLRCLALLALTFSFFLLFNQEKPGFAIIYWLITLSLFIASAGLLFSVKKRSE